MSTLRDEIRAILREEIRAIRTMTAAPTTETVRIAGSDDLTRFARELVSRASDPAFAADVAEGRVRFELAYPAATRVAAPASMVGNSPSRPAHVQFSKALITEKDIAAVGPEQSVIRLGSHSRLTPLAKDEARRRGLRIERGAS